MECYFCPVACRAWKINLNFSLTKNWGNARNFVCPMSGTTASLFMMYLEDDLPKPLPTAQYNWEWKSYFLNRKITRPGQQTVFFRAQTWSRFIAFSWAYLKINVGPFQRPFSFHTQQGRALFLKRKIDLRQAWFQKQRPFLPLFLWLVIWIFRTDWRQGW